MRLRRASPGMVGCFFTMARVSASAKREIKRENREFEILVFDPKEVELLFRGQHHVDDLLQAKRDISRPLGSTTNMAPAAKAFSATKASVITTGGSSA